MCQVEVAGVGYARALWSQGESAKGGKRSKREFWQKDPQPGAQAALFVLIDVPLIIKEEGLLKKRVLTETFVDLI